MLLSCGVSRLVARVLDAKGFRVWGFSVRPGRVAAGQLQKGFEFRAFLNPTALAGGTRLSDSTLV